jgi:lysophospholipase L1-like esterase
VRWQVVAKSGVNAREAIGLVESHPLSPADIVVSSLGVNDVTSQTNTRRLPAVPQPLRWYMGQCARRLDAALLAFCRENAARSYISLQWARARDMAADRFHPGKSQYREWARLVAGRIVEVAGNGAALAR